MKTKMQSKAILALLLSVVMVISMIPATALPVVALSYAQDGSYYISDDFSAFTTPPTSRPADGGWYGSGVTVNDGKAQVAVSGSLIYALPTAITQDFTVEFKFKHDTPASTFYIEFGPTLGTSGNAFYAQMASKNDNNGDMLKYFYGNGSGGATNKQFNHGATQNMLEHTVKFVVNYTNGTYSVYWDGNLKSPSDVPFVRTADFTQIVFRSVTTGAVCIDDFKIYTSDMENAGGWTVNLDATLDENIDFTFAGNAGSTTGIKSVRATMGGAEETGTVGADGAYSVTLPMAVSQMGETVTLDALDAEGEIVETKTYTLAGYLADLNAQYPDNEEQVALVNHTLNYGSAAAAYFGKTAVTAPAPTMAAVPGAEGVGIDVTTTGLYYNLPESVTEDYTLEFRYYVAKGESARVYVSNGNPTSATAQVYMQTTGAADSDTSGDRINTGDGTLQFGTSSNRFHGEWHTVKVVVNQTTDRIVFYLDGSDTPSTEKKFYTERNGRPNPDSVNRITFTVDGTKTFPIQIDDVKFTVGEKTVLVEDFTAFEYETTAILGSWVGTAANVTYNTELVNPVSGTCTGVTAKSANLLFEDQITIRYCLELAAGKSKDDYTIKIDDVVATNVVQSGNKVYVYAEDINPQEYGTDVKLTVSDGTDTLTVSYSVLDYITRMYEKDNTTTELKTLLAAMYNYYLAAKEFVG